MNTLLQPAFIDFEASSLNLLESYPIEAGICLPDSTTHSWLIKPHVLWRNWADSAEKIHGISREQLMEEGIEISEVADKLNSLLKGDVFCDAWTFDSFWQHRLFKAAKTKPVFQLDSISTLLNDEQIKQWQCVRAMVIKEMGIITHRAANDALILHETWLRLQHIK
jgi:DNA polymerase III epsilon subunit-like protein